MKIKEKMSVALIFGLFASFGLSGCHILEGGMNTVDPPTSLTTDEKQPDSILNDLSPIRARDMMLADKQDDR